MKHCKHLSTFQKKDDSENDCLITPNLPGDSRRENVDCQAIVRDIAESQKAMEKLETERKILEMVTQNVGAGLAIISKDYRIIWANKVVKRFFGEVEGKVCYSTYHGTTEICSSCGVREILEAGKEKVTYEHASNDVNGKTVWSQIIATPLRDGEGEITSVLELIVPITDRKRAEESLREKEEKYRTLFKQSKDAIYITSKDGELLDFNQSSRDLLGYSQEDPWIMDLDKIYADPEDRSRLRKEIEEKGSIKDYYVKLRKKDGTEIDCLFTASVRRDKDGSVLWHQGVIRDITDRRRAEEAVRKAEERYRKLFEDAPVMYVINDHRSGDPIIQDCNNLFLNNLDYSREEALGQPLTDFYSPQSREDFRAKPTFQKALDGGFTPIERELVARDGHIIKTLMHVVMEIDPDGNALKTRAMYVDITERKKAEEELEAKTRMNATLLDGLPCIATLLKTGSREIVLSNRLGQDAGGSPGKQCFSAWPKRETPCPWCLAPEAIASGRTQHREIETTEGKAWDLYWIPLGADQYIHYAFDITGKKQLEKQLIQAQKMEAIGQLAGGIAHDFNNILSGITGYTSILKMKMDENSPFFSGISMIEKSAWRAAELTRQLLGFARGGKYEVRQINLNHAVNNVLTIISETFDRAIAIHTDFTPDIWTVEGDAGQLEQVLLNICLNARDAMPFGGRLTLETGNVALDHTYAKTHLGFKEGDYVLLAISDTGAGITPEIQEKIFDPFFTTKEIGKGTGLGLAMVYGIVKNHEGHISVESNPERGSCFKIYLPASKKTLQKKAKPASITITTGSGTILLVDDEEIVRELGKTILEELGYQVIPAGNGQEACAIFAERKEQIDLVLLDMIMPGMGGRETYLKLKGINSRIKVLFCSGDVLSGQVLNELKEGVRGFVQKPFNMQQLAQSVSAALLSAQAIVHHENHGHNRMAQEFP